MPHGHEGSLPQPGIEPESPTLEGGFLSFFFLGCAGSLLLCGFFSSCRQQGLRSSCRAQGLIVVASLITEHGL